MNWLDFALILIGCVATMALCRVIPVFVLKDKELPQEVSQALGFIPPAAFAALVANDLFSIGIFDMPLHEALIPFIAAAVTVLVAIRTKSLIWCIVAGVGTYAALLGISWLIVG